jgi:hypothetical protein
MNKIASIFACLMTCPLGEAVVYDNKMGEDDDSNAGSEVGGGSIASHKDK